MQRIRTGKQGEDFVVAQPKEKVGLEKRKKLSRVSLHHVQQNRSEASNARFDVVVVKMFSAETRIDPVQNAFNLIL